MEKHGKTWKNMEKHGNLPQGGWGELGRAGENWGGLGSAGEDWRGLGRAAESWGQLARAGEKEKKEKKKNKRLPWSRAKTPYECFDCKAQETAHFFQKCLSTKTTSMKQEHEEGEEEEQETALEQSKDPL